MAGGLDSIELSCGWCLDWAPETGPSTSTFVRNNGRIGSGTFCTELNEYGAVVVFSVLTVSLRAEPKLLRKGATAADWELWKELYLVVVLVTSSLPAGLSTMSASCEVGE